MDFPIIIDWEILLSFLGASGVFFFIFIIFLLNILLANRIAPDGTPRSAASHLGLCCLPMSPKKDARLICVKVCVFLFLFFHSIAV